MTAAAVVCSPVDGWLTKKLLLAALLLLALLPAEGNRAGKASRPRPPGPPSVTLSASEAEQKAFNLSQSAKNVTFLLDNLLKNYDNSLRPDMGGELKQN